MGGTGAFGSSRYAGRAAEVAVAYSRILPRSIGMIAIGCSADLLPPAPLRTVTGSASRCSSTAACILAIVSSSPSPIRGPGVKVAGRCFMPWMTPIVW